jgi:hypothetical protein
MKAVLAALIACCAPGLACAASLTGSIVASSAPVDLRAVGTLDWARWPGYSHKGSAMSDVTTCGTFKVYRNDSRLVGDRSGIKVAGPGAAFEFTVAATTVERTLTYYIGGWNSTGRVTVTLPGAKPYTTTFTSAGVYSRVVTIKFRADSMTTLKVNYTQTAGAGSITMQAAALSTAGSSALLTWQAPAANTDGSALSDLAAYKVYWGPTQGTYPHSTHIANAAARSHTVTGLGTGTWYFVVTALTSQGVESAHSNVWSKSVP